jgi:glucosamine 6-phosphate synthetase-like amidotransferase/phosphosugar isomerase protein
MPLAPVVVKWWTGSKAQAWRAERLEFVPCVPHYLGYGLTHPIALEGALKLKEITYAHCEGIFSSEFKHGPLSAVETAIQYCS